MLQLLSLCHRTPLIPAAVVVAVLILEAYVGYEEDLWTFSFTSISEILAPDAVDLNRSMGACLVFISVELFLLICALCLLKENQSFGSRRLGRSLLVMAALYLVGFLCLRHGLQSVKFSVFWASDCSEYWAEENQRLAHFDSDLSWAEEKLLPKSNPSSDEKCVMFISINAVPNRTERYLSQTIGSLLRSLSPEEVSGVRIEILADGSFEELQKIKDHSLEPLVKVIYNPARRQTPRGTSTASWRQGSVLHYLHAMERCIAKKAEYCLVLDDDTLASQGWLSKALKEVRQLESGNYGAEGKQWMILKLFQPVWGNERQNWHGGNMFLLLAMGLLGAIPCGLLANCPCQNLTPSHFFWSLGGFAAALFVFWAAGKANLEWIVGDGAVHPHGTCHMAQANLFHRARAESAGFLEHLKNQSLQGPFIDLLICDFFQQKNEPMWTTSPSLFQHAGLKTSLPDKLGTSPCRIHIFHEGLWRPRVEERPDRSQDSRPQRFRHSWKEHVWERAKLVSQVNCPCLLACVVDWQWQMRINDALIQNIWQRFCHLGSMLAWIFQNVFRQVLLGELKGGLSFEAHCVLWRCLNGCGMKAVMPQVALSAAQRLLGGM